MHTNYINNDITRGNPSEAHGRTIHNNNWRAKSGQHQQPRVSASQKGRKKLRLKTIWLKKDANMDSYQ